ncbi:hypothetical protein KI387_020726, partial [Taxus chinensis]
MEALGFWVDEALWAYDDLSIERWERVKALNIVVKLELLCSRLVKCCMEGLVSHSGPLEESLDIGLLKEDNQSTGFNLSRDVKNFLVAFTSASSPILFVPFLIEGGSTEQIFSDMGVGSNSGSGFLLVQTRLLQWLTFMSHGSIPTGFFPWRGFGAA